VLKCYYAYLFLELVCSTTFLLQLSIQFGHALLQSTLTALEIAALGVLGAELLFEDLDFGVENVVIFLPSRLDRAFKFGRSFPVLAQFSFNIQQIGFKTLRLSAFVGQLVGELFGLNICVKVLLIGHNLQAFAVDAT
jgi:hypothetical protein